MSLTKEVTGGEGVNGSVIKFFHKNSAYVPRSKCKQKPLKEIDEKH
jgi:hypothetical protein